MSCGKGPTKLRYTGKDTPYSGAGVVAMPGEAVEIPCRRQYGRLLLEFTDVWEPVLDEIASSGKVPPQPSTGSPPPAPAAVGRDSKGRFLKEQKSTMRRTTKPPANNTIAIGGNGEATTPPAQPPVARPSHIVPDAEPYASWRGRKG